MADLKFEWDAKKNISNKKKHGVKSDFIIRIISARKANRSEQRRYWDRWKK